MNVSFDRAIERCFIFLIFQSTLHCCTRILCYTLFVGIRAVDFDYGLPTRYQTTKRHGLLGILYFIIDSSSWLTRY